jgi:hypothetical protein
MKFRFQVVKSAFHKGRLKFSYDPVSFATNEYNINFVEVIDIAEKTDFTITVGNAQTKTLLTHLYPGLDARTQAYNTASLSTNTAGNGVLSVRVVNKLSTPDPVSGQTIRINVFVSMGDDFEVFVPDHFFQKFTFAQPDPTPQGLIGEPPAEEGESLDPQSTDAEMKGDDIVGALEPVSNDECFIGPQLQYEDMISRVWIGEAIHSFRPLLKRYCLHRSYTNEDTQDKLIRVTQPIYPFIRGYVNGAVDQTAVGDNYNYVNQNIIHWVVLAHAGWRGGIRRKILPRGQFDYISWYAQRQDIADSGEINYSYATVVPPNTNDVDSLNWRNLNGNAESGQNSVPFLGWQGIAYQNDAVNPVFEIESPFYHPDRFFPAKRLDYTGTGPKVERLNLRIMSKGSNLSAFDTYVSVAEDFQVFFFTGLPRAYFEDTPPLAT